MAESLLFIPQQISNTVFPSSVHLLGERAKNMYRNSVNIVLDAILNVQAGDHGNLLLPLQGAKDEILFPLKPVDIKHSPQAPEHADDE